MTARRIAILCEQPPTESEQSLAIALQCPLLTAVDSASSGYLFYLQLTPGQGLTLTSVDQPGARHGVRVDFTDKALAHRRRDSFRRQNLARAIGVKGGATQCVIDATAGMGADAFLLASAGCHVLMLERDPVVHALLTDGIARATQDAELRAPVARMRLHQGDLSALADRLPTVDVVYLDPMFPEDRSSARSKKAMYLLQQLLGPQQDNPVLFDRAMEKARKRVVVKRARKADHYVGREPSFSVCGSSSRYDVYVKA